MNSDATLTQDRKPVLLGVTWAWTAVASIFVTLRFYCRVKYQRKLWWDDWWILIASVRLSTPFFYFLHLPC